MRPVTWRRGLAIAAATLAIGVFLLLASLMALLGTEAGSRWTLARIPGLEVEDFSGRLAGHWSASALGWEQGATRVELDKPEFEWGPACLLKMTLCIEKLHAEQIRLQLAPSAEATDDGPVSMPDLHLPLAIRLEDVRIGSLLLAGSEQMRDLQVAAHWTREGLRLDNVHLEREDLVLDLAGLVEPSGDWPLSATALLKLPDIDGRPWTLNLDIKGDLLDSLQLNGISSGYLMGQLQGQVQPLKPNVPAQLTITAQPFTASSTLPETLQLQQLKLDARGDLQAGYQLNGTAVLPASQGPVSVVLDGRVDAKGAVIKGLDLEAGAEQRLSLQGSLNWEHELRADASVQWLDFPWQRLYPLADAPQVTLRRFSGEVSYTRGKYLGNFTANLDGPAGPFSLTTPFSGDLTQVFLPELELVAGQGRASGHLNLQFADGISWDTALDLSALDPAYWVAQMPGTLAGPLRSKGQFKEQRLSLDADLDLKGRLRGQPATLRVKADGAGDVWTIGHVEMRLGDNLVQGSGSVQQRLNGQLDISLPRLGQLWPGLQGQVKGRLEVAGSLHAPQGQLGLQGSQLAFQDNRLQALDVSAKLDSAQRATVDVKGNNIQLGDTQLGNLLINGQGDIKRQSLKMDLQGPLLKLGIALDGTLDKGAWRGRLATGAIQTGGQSWKLQHPASLERLADGTVNFGAHCWLSGAASLCGEDQRLMPEPRLRYHLKNFPLQSLAQWFPKDFGWKGALNADVQLDVPASGPNGQIMINASGGTLRVKDKTQWHDFPYQNLQLTSRMTPKAIDSRLEFRGDQLGTLVVNARIDPLAKDKTLNGDFSLAGLDLSIARPFVPMVQRLTGRLDGSGRLSGSLLTPQVNGSIILSRGEVSGPELPVSLQDLRVEALIAGENVQLDGTWRSGENGKGSLGGRIGWGQSLLVDLALKGSRLPVTVEPYARLEVAPDLKISMREGGLGVSGKVLIPKGAITIRELPPSTVKLSGDTVIVGQPVRDGSPTLAMAMDIDVQVGQEQLSFSGFGLTADLAGRVHIGDNLDTRGELNLNNGRYRAYGQRLTIRKARLLFAGPVDQPYLDVEAIRQTDDVVAGIRLSGSAEQPTTTVFSEPAMSQEQALSYLVLGRPLNNTGEDNNMMAQAALALGLAGSESTTGKLAKDLGIKDFELDTSGSGDETNVVASGKITDKLSLRYGVGVFEPANTIALRYLLSKRVYLEAASGIASSLDIFYKRDF